MELYNLIYHASAALILLLGLAVLIYNRGQKNSWIFSMWAVSAAAWMQSMYWGFWFSAASNWGFTLLAFRFAFALGVLLLSLMTIFYYYFPKVSFTVRQPIRWLYVTFTIFLTVVSLTPLIHQALVIEDGVYVGDVFGALYPLYTFDIVLNFLAGLYLAFNKLRRTRGIERNKIALVTFGYFVFIFFAILTNVILPYFGIILLPLQQLVPFMTLVFLVPTFYALQKYRFFNFSYIALNTIRKLSFYALFLFLIYFLYKSFLWLSPEGSRLLFGSISIVVSLAIVEKLQSKVPSFISSSLRELRNTMREINTILYSCDSFSKLRNLLEHLFQVKLNYAGVQLYVVRKAEDSLKIDIYKKNDFTNALQGTRRDIIIREELALEEQEKSTDVLVKGMKELQADLCMPLFSEGNLIGFLAVRSSGKNHTFAEEEVQEILSIKRGLEITLMNLLLKTNLVEENNLMKTIIDKKTKQLKKKIIEINELLKQQSDFIAVTAHEFRTPLSVAMFQLDEVLESEKPKNEMLEDLKLIDSSLDNLKDLTQKLFAVQQYDLNKVSAHLETVSMRDFIKEVYEEFIYVMKDKKIDFTLKNESRSKLNAQIDKGQLRQVFHNLLNNAFKFTPNDGKVMIEVLDDKKEVELVISDSGEGIPDTLKASIFNKFRTKAAGSGIGLGLYLCKKIMDLHKGRIWVEDSPLGGASFHVSLKKKP